MRAFACALAISLGAAWSGAAASSAPARVASLNLCADELILAIADPDQIVSVTHLAQGEDENPSWRAARRYRANDGGLVSVAGLRPDLIVTMGGLGRDRERLARRMGVRLIALPFPASLDDVERSILRLGVALGRERRAQGLVAALRRARATQPPRLISGLYIGAGGSSFPSAGLGAQWMALAGLRQAQLQGDRVSVERLLTAPPVIALRSDYRIGQASRGARWPGYRTLNRARDTRTLATDGRRWTCMGPSLLPEIMQLRRAIAQ